MNTKTLVEPLGFMPSPCIDQMARASQRRCVVFQGSADRVPGAGLQTSRRTLDVHSASFAPHTRHITRGHSLWRTTTLPVLSSQHRTRCETRRFSWCGLFPVRAHGIWDWDMGWLAGLTALWVPSVQSLKRPGVSRSLPRPIRSQERLGISFPFSFLLYHLFIYCGQQSKVDS